MLSVLGELIDILIIYFKRNMQENIKNRTGAWVESKGLSRRARIGVSTGKESKAANNSLFKIAPVSELSKQSKIANSPKKATGSQP